MRVMDATPSDPLLGAEAIAPRRLAEGVLAALSAAILDGRLPAGAALPSEAALAARFGVSKQTVREAIRELASLGVLEVFSGRATRVRTLDAEPLARFWRFAVGTSHDALAEAVELRRLLEPPIARLAALRADAASLAGIEEALGRMRKAAGDIPAWIAADLDFHEAVARAAGNRLALLQVRGLRPVVELLMQHFNRSRPRTEADWQATLRRHVRVAAAIAAHNPDAAQAAMLAHFSAAGTAMAELFGAKLGRKARGGKQ
jgi:GntR family transcriptional repressor for pyruvate dehydrogenase complex